MTDTTPPIPPVLMRRIQSACREGMTGRLVLNMHQGEIQSWEITESGRVEPRRVPAMPEIAPFRDRDLIARKS